MSLDLEELEKKIERKISELENEKNRLKDDLKVVRQAVHIASEFGGSDHRDDWEEPDRGYEESQAV
jgi:hypothetical protein